MYYFNYDIVIIGAGGAGLTAALYAKEQGMSVAVISKVHPLHSHTSAAQGGINAALGTSAPDDWRWHMYDTVKGSDWLGDQDAIELLCKSAPDAIAMLEKWGTHFDRNERGVFEQKIYGGQTMDFGKGGFAKRVCAVADHTGDAIMHALYTRSIEAGVVYFNYNYAIDLLMKNGSSYGVSCLDLENGKINIIRASYVIIATGGYSQIYQTSTSSSICSGDGNGLIFRAGLPLQDMEFVQFHPTAMYKVGVLITEAARALGGKLINGDGQRFMARYAPNLMELACRDVVARAISTEISQGRGCGSNKDHVLLDLTHLSRESMLKHLPTVLENCRQFLGLDPAQVAIPIAPAAHYTMGGIPTNINCQVVDIDKNYTEKAVNGLYAIGEAACISVHGANRLGCNSLLDLVVFARVAIDHIVSDFGAMAILNDLELGIKNRLDCCLHNDGVAQNIFSITELKAELKGFMSKNVGLFRTKELLEIGIQALKEIRLKFEKIRAQDDSLQWNNELIEYLEFENLLISAEVTTHAALMRHESRGAHYREDFPRRDDELFMYHSIVKKNAINGFSYFQRKVRLNTQSVDFFPPENRNY